MYLLFSRLGTWGRRIRPKLGQNMYLLPKVYTYLPMVKVLHWFRAHTKRKSEYQGLVTKGHDNRVSHLSR